MIELEEGEEGVYRFEPDGTLTLIHEFLGGDYALIDILDFFELGEMLEAEGAQGLELDRKELDRLAALCEEAAEDHPAEFIEMCQDIVAAGDNVTAGAVRFFANF